MNRPIKTFESLHNAARVVVPSRPEGGEEPRAVPLVGIVRNPRSHGNLGYEPELAGEADVMIETAAKRRDLTEVLARFALAGVDFIVIDGGDGTVRDVLTCGEGVFGEQWPPIIVLPKGKTNALAADLRLPGRWKLDRAIERARAGSFAIRRPLVVAEVAQPEARVQGFVLGAGVFSKAIALGQSAHRWGAFNAPAVLVTTFWSLLQAVFAKGTNGWRRCTTIRLEGEDGTPLAGYEDERYMLLSSTLENFPLGLKPFGGSRAGLKVAVLDRPRRKSLARIPLIAIGRLPTDPPRHGYHWTNPDTFLMALSDRFVLDGEAFPAGTYRVSQGPELRFVVP